MRNFKRLSFLFFILIVSCFSAEKEKTVEEKSAETVVTLTTDNFDKFIKENSLVLVEFYAPWCGHCKSLAPHYEQAAKILKGKPGAVPLAKVDATAETELAERFEVGGYPTLKLFREGEPEEFKGERDADGIVKWVEENSGPAVEVVADEKAATARAKEVSVAFVGAFAAKGSAKYEIFEAVAKKTRSLGKFIAFVHSSAKDTVSVHRQHDGMAATSPVESKDDLISFCKSERFPYFGPIDGNNYSDYFGSGQDIVWLAGSEKDYEKLGPAIREAAKNFRGKNSFVWLDVEKFKDHATGALAAKEFPALVVQSKDSRFVYPSTEFAETSKIVKFVTDAADGKIERTLLSEDVPESNEEPVKVVVGKTFKDMVFQKDKDVLLEVYAPWCGHCKRFEPIYTEFAKKHASNKNLLVAKMDGTANESPVGGFVWQGFPTIFFVKAGADTPTVYEGDRTVDGLDAFLEKPTAAKKETEEQKEEL